MNSLNGLKEYKKKQTKNDFGCLQYTASIQNYFGKSPIVKR